MIALRQAGFEPVVACMGTALTEQQLRELAPPDQAALARLRRRRRRRVGDAARDGARRRAGLRRQGRRAAAGDRSGRRSGWVRGEAGNGAPVRPLPHAGRGAPRGGPRGRPTDRDGVPQRRAGVAQPAGRLALGERLLRHADPDPRRRHRQRGDPAVAPARARRRPARARRARRRHRLSEPPPVLAEIPPDHFRDETSRALRAHLVAGTPPGGRALALLAELDAWGPAEGIDEPTARSTCSGSANARSGPSSSRPTSRERRSCARRSPGSRRRLRPWARVARPRTEPMPRRGDGHVPTVRRSGPCSALCCDWTTSFMPWPRTSRGEPYSGAGRDALPT